MSDENAIKLAQLTKSFKPSHGENDHVPESLPETDRSTASQCKWCQNKFKSKQTMLAHQKTCPECPRKTIKNPLKMDDPPVQRDTLEKIVTLTLPIAHKKSLTQKQTKENTSQTEPFKQTNIELIKEIELTKKALAEMPLEFAMRENKLQVREFTTEPI